MWTCYFVLSLCEFNFGIMDMLSLEDEDISGLFITQEPSQNSGLLNEESKDESGVFFWIRE